MRQEERKGGREHRRYPGDSSSARGGGLQQVTTLAPAAGAGSLEGAPRDPRQPCAARRRTPRVTQQLVPAD